jgi:hypothetical protein
MPWMKMDSVWSVVVITVLMLLLVIGISGMGPRK